MTENANSHSLVQRQILQTTIGSPVSFKSEALHSGGFVNVTIFPARPDTGIVFRRTDCGDKNCEIPARWDLVSQAELCTQLVNRDGVSVGTVEHVMAALYGCGVYNAIIEVDRSEVAIMDGSSIDFVSGILDTGIVKQNAPLKALRILKAVEVVRGRTIARLYPHEHLVIDFTLEYDDTVIGFQRKTLNMANGSFVRELSASRTYCYEHDVEKMFSRGLARGGKPGENALVLSKVDVVSPGGLRQPDEPLRHKMLDVVGDLALVGMPILGYYQGIRAGHAITNVLLRTLFADDSTYEIVECSNAIAECLPGAGVEKSEVPIIASG